MDEGIRQLGKAWGMTQEAKDMQRILDAIKSAREKRIAEKKK